MSLIFSARWWCSWVALTASTAWAGSLEEHSVQPPVTEALSRQNVAVLAATCSNCHGPDGRSPGDHPIPSLRGLPAERLLQRMQAFKAGTEGTVMTRLMAGYDDAQIRALARWFSAGEEP